jgi:hypothetical protein
MRRFVKRGLMRSKQKRRLRNESSPDEEKFKLRHYRIS